MAEKMSTRYTEEFGPNVTMILVSAYRIIKGRIPREVRKQLMSAVRAGVLGRCKKDGLLPEVFYHPDHKHGAMDARKRDAIYSIECIKNVVC